MPPIDDGFRERLLAFISRRVERPEDAEDLLQEVYVKIAQSADGLRDRGRLEAWIYQIALDTHTVTPRTPCGCI